jgi:hypothetical protein
MPGGGVCAVLDYEVEAMAEYVAEMTTRLTSGNGVAPADLRKFVSQILSSTRLPSTTILLGMNYLSKRINMLNLAAGGTQPKMTDGQVWRMLTVALLLGSKFLDDNTFQNRSWAEVSGIPVRELNTMENEWMRATRWNLYVNIDRSEDYNAWLKSWQDWSQIKKRHQGMARDRMAPVVSAIDTGLTRSRSTHAQSSWHQQQIAEYERLNRIKRNEQAEQQQQQQQQACRVRDAAWPSYDHQLGAWPTSPLTPPDSGYGTPDYVDSASSVNSQLNDWFSQNNRGPLNPSYSRRPHQQSHHQQSQYPQTASTESYRTGQQTGYGYRRYGHNIWEQNSPSCRCQSCIAGSPQHKQPWYFGAPNFSQQLVN